MRQLKTIIIDDKEYFIDERLCQIRQVDNPHHFEDVSPELIDFWINKRVKSI